MSDILVVASPTNNAVNCSANLPGWNASRRRLQPSPSRMHQCIGFVRSWYAKWNLANGQMRDLCANRSLSVASDKKPEDIHRERPKKIESVKPDEHGVASAGAAPAFARNASEDKRRGKADYRTPVLKSLTDDSVIEGSDPVSRSAPLRARKAARAVGAAPADATPHHCPSNPHT